ncbi:unnamed protein product [Haemonchus placei]|uniref:Secreted protein n=1 Tax=Haemonchus placei TaxID=6290 RepID=A0A0N4W174_HAEPC|nr:unnamed protein product [Haemonchus placei]
MRARSRPLWRMIMTSTVLPILCLMDWNSPKCRLNAPPPRFAPNYDVNKARAHDLARNRAKSAIRGNEDDRISDWRSSGTGQMLFPCIKLEWEISEHLIDH